MIPNALQQDFDVLPPEAKQQVVDFVAFMKARYTKAESHPGQSADISSLFGILESDKHVTLDDMDAAIRKRGGEL